MSRHAPNWVIAAISGLVLLTSSALPQEEAATPAAKQQATLKLAEQVRKQIVTQPQYGVFDFLHFAMQGETVILRGKASRPTLKSSVENAVKKIEGVNNVTNEIEVLPASAHDDRLRRAVYASIYRYPALQRYTANRGGPRGIPSVARAAGGITNDPPIRLPCDPHCRRKRQRDLDGCGGLGYGSGYRRDAGKFCSGRV